MRTRLLSVLATSTLALLIAACATDPADEVMTSASEGDETEDVVSDEGLGASADELQGAATVGATVYTTAVANFRRAPDDGAVIRTLPRNTAVTIVRAQAEEGFYRVSHQGTEGYVHGALLTASASNGRRVTTNVVYLGSCEFLGNCASADTKRAWRENKTIYFGCDGRETCSDTQPYISVPRNGIACGATVKLCRTSDPSICVDAIVREKSDRNQRYEVSVAAAKGLGYDPEDGFYPAGGSRTCSGSLGGDSRVTIRY